MSTLSSAGWIVHDVGLATSIGGSLFGNLALEPAIKEVSNTQERDEISESAWKRFNWVNLASHVAFAVPWFIGRTMLDGGEVTTKARQLTVVKDVLVGASLVTGISSFIIGRMLGRRARRGEGPEQMKSGRRGGDAKMSPVLERAVSILGVGNLLATAGVMAVTSLLAMEGSKSVRFAPRTRWLP
jgi:uncharacterized membrane protein